jgi:transposase-like protein
MEKCKYCGGELWKNGVVNGVQRFRCKKCGKFSSGSSPKYSEQDRERAIKMYLNGCGVRKTALFIGCSPGTILNWIRERAESIQLETRHVDGDIIEMDEIFAQVAKGVVPNPIKKNGHM